MPEPKKKKIGARKISAEIQEKKTIQEELEETIKPVHRRKTAVSPMETPVVPPKSTPEIPKTSPKTKQPTQVSPFESDQEIAEPEETSQGETAKEPPVKLNEQPKSGEPKVSPFEPGEEPQVKNEGRPQTELEEPAEENKKTEEQSKQKEEEEKKEEESEEKEPEQEENKKNTTEDEETEAKPKTEPEEEPETESKTGKGAEKLGEEAEGAGEKAAETGAKAGAVGARAGAAAAGETAATGAAAGEVAAAGSAGAWGPVVLAILGVIIVIVILVFVAIACSNQYGSSVHQPDNGDEGTKTRAYAGDNAAQSELSATEGGELKDNVEKINGKSPISGLSTAKAKDIDLKSLPKDTIAIIDSLLALEPNQAESRTEMINQINTKYRQILDLLGVHIIGLPGHLENLGSRKLTRIEVILSERRMYFYASGGSQGELVLGSAPVYFGYNALNNLEGQSLPSSSVKIKKIWDAGNGQQFIDKNGYGFGRYYIELEGNPGAIISANPKDEILTSQDYSLAILRATSGPLRMASADLGVLAEYLQKSSASNLTIEFKAINPNLFPDLFK